jgi:hypothetical protein
VYKNAYQQLNLLIMLKAYPVPAFYGPQIGLAISHKEVYEGIFNTSQQYNPQFTMELILSWF